MDILLINPPIRVHDKPRHLPHGLAIIASVLRKKVPGIRLHFLDWNAYRWSEAEIRERIRATPCDLALVGGLIPVYGRLIWLAAVLKEAHPRALVVAGGSAAMSVPELLLAHSQVDLICTGEGELTASELVAALAADRQADLTGIPGLAYRGPDGGIVFTPPRPLIEDLDRDSDLPAYDLLPMEIYLANQIIGFGRDVDFISSRGCPFHCTFCYQPWGRRFRGHSVEFISQGLE
ncbi:MAG: cobalamin-dependent protein, partial [Thermodesulfobacteriota bacterium]